MMETTTSSGALQQNAPAVFSNTANHFTQRNRSSVREPDLTPIKGTTTFYKEGGKSASTSRREINTSSIFPLKTTYGAGAFQVNIRDIKQPTIFKQNLQKTANVENENID